ncbi:Brix-domain-containing protein [Syncephalis pseudoplumigaleata]|uniref:Ribosome production factor 2 homolog n=1 Tax=Syncephalis pseudoplumigaleata TaxID=1712513 RepID=A0A4P9YYW7_9FUNG|nr:Brix-domain-containing protein [Syncephalis pseudoplumigaleata]|eukprot:RKP24210.1 Brix-domain-containing protein [Syncephalis pseudoplumigaleata]
MAHQVVNDALTDLYLLKKPQAIHFTKKNDIRPFEDETPLEFLSQKNDASLFAVGSHSKKRPHNIVLGRMFDHHLLDMIEIGLDRFVSMNDYKAGMKPCMVFNGDLFDQQEEYIKLKNLLLDFFQGEKADAVNLEGLEHVMVVTAGPMPAPNKMGRVFLRVYTEMGPSMDFTIRRTQFAPDELMKQALRVPAEIKKKKVKNVEHDELGDQFGRIHMERQDFGQLQTRKMKGLKRRADDEDDDDSSASDDAEDDDGASKQTRKSKAKGKRTRAN